jgi:hypothetical protein
MTRCNCENLYGSVSSLGTSEIRISGGTLRPACDFLAIERL